MEQDLRLQILRHAVRDVAFLKASAADISPEHFPDGPERILIKAALQFYSKYETPIGGMLLSMSESLAQAERLPASVQKKIKEIIVKINGASMEPISIKALSDRLRELRTSTFYHEAVEEIITAHEERKLTPALLADIVARAERTISPTELTSRDFFGKGAIDKRNARRSMWDSMNNRYPKLMIEPLDKKIRLIGRGHFGMWLAPWASGKGMALVWTTLAYAQQGLNVIHITLEDPIDEVENRMDANLTGLPMNSLSKLPNKLKKRFRRVCKTMRGRVRLVDGTEGGITVTKIERIYEQHRQKGFVADAIIIDYDDEIECEVSFKGESAKRMAFGEIYRRLKQLAARLNIIIWTAAQGTRGSESKKVITGQHASEDVSKVRKVFLAIGIGRSDVNKDDQKFLFVLRHRLDRSRFGVDIASNFAKGIFYDREKTIVLVKELQKKAASKKK